MLASDDDVLWFSQVFVQVSYLIDVLPALVVHFSTSRLNHKLQLFPGRLNRRGYVKRFALGKERKANCKISFWYSNLKLIFNSRQAVLELLRVHHHLHLLQ